MWISSVTELKGCGTHALIGQGQWRAIADVRGGIPALEDDGGERVRRPRLDLDGQSPSRLARSGKWL